MNPEEMVSFRRELAAVDALLAKLMPEDDLSRLAIDPKRQQAAAQMVGTVILARDVLAKGMRRLDQPSPNGAVHHKRGRDRAKGRGRAGGYVLQRLEKAAEPLLRAELARDAVAAGHATKGTTVYGVFARLIEDGRIKLNKKDNTLEFVR